MNQINSFNSSNKINKIEFVVLFFTGFIGLSTLSNQITQFLGLPYIIEIYFIPIYFFYKKHFKKEEKYFLKMNNVSFFFFILLLIFSTFLGIINTSWDFFNVITCIRPLIYLSILANLFSRKLFKIDIYKIYIIAFGALCGELFNKVFFMNSISSIDHINTQALALIIIIPFIKKNKMLIFFSIVFGLLLSIMTLYRRFLVLFVIALLSGLFYYIIKQKSIKMIFSSFIFSYIGWLVYENYKVILTFIINILGLDNVTSYYLSGTYRLVEKFEIINNASDNLRKSVLDQVVTTFNEKIIPAGPIGKSKGLWYFGAYTDTTNVFFYDVFGSIISWIIIVTVALKAVKCYLNTILNKINGEEYVLSGLMVPIFIISMLFDGTFLVHANISILAGYSIHGWFEKVYNK